MARRGENIYKRRDGRWEARYIKTRTLAGKAVYGYIYRRSYLEAKRAQAEAKANSMAGQMDPHRLRHPKNLEAYLTAWLPLIQESVKKSTFANYRGLIRRHIIPDLGKVPLEQLSSELVQDYINRKLKLGRLDGTAGLSVKTAKDIIGLIKRSLKPMGIDLQIKLPRYNLPKPRVLSPSEQSALINAAQCTDDLEGFGVLLSLFTGIRIGELCSLKWRDISLNEGVLRVNKTLQRLENYEGGKSKTVIDIGTPKSESSVRNIPLPQFLLQKVMELKEIAGDDDYILSGSRHYVEPRQCQHHFKKLVREAGIPDVNFHVLRHTFATRCVELGIDIKTISEVLGHSSVNMTLNRYVHPAFEHQRECLEKLSVSL
jgi:integrase